MASTLTSTAAASTGPIRAVHAGVNSVSATFADATVMTGAVETSIFMVKVPNGATILDVVGSVSSGAATCPFVMGINDPTDGGDTSSSLFATSGTIAYVCRATKNIPYDVSVSDDAAVQYQYVTMAVTPGTTTTAVEAKLTVLYTMDR